MDVQVLAAEAQNRMRDIPSPPTYTTAVLGKLFYSRLNNRIENPKEIVVVPTICLGLPATSQSYLWSDFNSSR